MKLLIFGTGDYYRKYKKWINEEDIDALIDNDTEKQGTIYEGHIVIRPDEVVKRVFDYIIILSVHEAEMRQQLCDIGVQNDKILKFSEIYKHPEFCTEEKNIEIYGKSASIVQSILKKNNRSILLMSHNMDLNGASLALFYMAKILKENQYGVVFASWNDGEMRAYLNKENIPIIIDSNLEIKTAANISWVQCFPRIICNTVNYYQFLSDRSFEHRIIWWLHDPEMFYSSLDFELLKKISPVNMKIYAVGELSEKAMKKYRKDFEIEQLVCGIPHVDLIQKQSTQHNKLEICVTGNVQYYKGQDVLIDALSYLDESERKCINIKIIGPQESQYATDLKAKARKYDNLIEFVMPVNREKIHSLLNETDLYVCSSRVDTMSISTNEAMQHGIPCIVSDAAGVSKYISNGLDGFVFPSENAEKLAGKIKWCIANRERLPVIGKKSHEIYEKYFSMKVFEKELIHAITFFDDGL